MNLVYLDVLIFFYILIKVRLTSFTEKNSQKLTIVLVESLKVDL